MKDFDSFGVMLATQSKASMSPEAMKRFFKIIASMGYNQVFLYTEDKIEVDNEPYHGYMRGRYTQEELSWELLPYKEKEQSWWYRGHAASIDIALH